MSSGFWAEYGVVSFDHKPFEGEWLCLVPVSGDGVGPVQGSVVRVEMPGNATYDGFIWVMPQDGEDVVRLPFWLPMPEVVG